MNKEREIINETMECLYNSIKSKDKIINEQVLMISKLNDKFNQVIDFINTWEKYKKENKPLEVTLLDLLYIKEILEDKIIFAKEIKNEYR